MDSSMDISIDPAGLGTSKVSVDEVTAMVDVELAQFVQRHDLSNGDYHLPVDGRDKLSTNERIHLAESLGAQQRSRAQSPNPCPRPLDLAELDTLLQQVSLDKSFTLQPESQTVHHSGYPTPPFDPTRRETDAYHHLVNDGGRPVYPIDLIQEIYRDTKSYAEILRPWQVYNNSPDGIFSRQWRRWQDFRKWQNSNRDRDDDDGGFEAYVEGSKQVIRRDSLPKTDGKRLAPIEADTSCLKSEWDRTQYEHRMQRRVCREHGCRGFREYIEAVKGRFVRHGISPPPFELDEDPNKQDKLTTWIEYLNYEYWWLDLYASDIKQLETERDKFWKELVDSEILEYHETKHFIYNFILEKDREVERDRASKAVQRERSEVLTRQDTERSDIPEAVQKSMLERAERALNHANQQLERAQKRSRFVEATVCCDYAKDNAARQHRVVQWVLYQLLLLKTELNPSIDNRSGRSGLDGTRRAKRGRTNNQEQAERQDPKRVQSDLWGTRMAYARAVSKATEIGGEEILVASSSTRKDARAVLGGFRRSARIAARRDTSRSS